MIDSKVKRFKRPISMAEMFGADDKTKKGRCAQCGAEVDIPEFIIEGAKAMNHLLAKQQHSKDDLLTTSNLIACDGCKEIVARDIDANVRADRFEADRLLDVARAGGHLSNAEVLWLHTAGFRKQLNAIFKARKQLSSRDDEL